MLDATTAPAEPEVTAAPDGVVGRPRKRLRRRLAWPFGIGFLVQLLLVVGDKLPSVDGVSYFETGRNFVDGKGYVRSGAPELHFPPVAPVSLGYLWKLLGSEIWALRTWNLFWGMAAVVVLTGIARFLSRDDDATVATAAELR